MRLLIQRVLRAQALEGELPNSCIAKVEKGMLVLVGVGPTDQPATADFMLQKLKGLRIFSDPQGKMNLPCSEAKGGFLFVSQFTLFADCRKGSRPSFTGAAPRELAVQCYERLISQAPRILEGTPVSYTPFGANLHIELINDGPVTIWLDSDTLR